MLYQYTTMRCGNCREEGHRRDKCPNPVVEPDPHRKQVRCGNCGELGHRKPTCTNPTNADRQREMADSAREYWGWMCGLEWDTDEEALAWSRKWMLMTGWETQGIRPAGTWEDLAAKYLATDTCDMCGSTKRLIVEHIHLPVKGNVRGICCYKCNSQLRFIDSYRQRLMRDIRTIARFARILDM